MNCFSMELKVIFEQVRFPSPCGDELFHQVGHLCAVCDRFRPLAGMNCFRWITCRYIRRWSFRPLAGMNCFYMPGRFSPRGSGFRPLAGMNCFGTTRTSSASRTCFRPLAGMNCFLYFALACAFRRLFPSPCGDELFQSPEDTRDAGLLVSVPLRG